ncbi:MAG: hypothetical protein QM764_12430 [Chitinophagaceae bacterium]
MYLQRLLTVIFLAGIFSFAIGNFFDHLYKQKLSFLFNGDANEILEGKENYDIIFLGNSKIHSGIDPYYVDSVTEKKTYNFALGGADAPEIKLLSTLYLQTHTAPEIVVLGIDNSMLSSYNILKERFFYLFYLKNDTISKYMADNGFPARLIEALPFTKYSFFDEYSRASMFDRRNGIERQYKGFVVTSLTKVNSMDTSIHNSEKKPFYRPLPGDENVNDTSANFITEMVKLFVEKGTHVIFLRAPLKYSTQKIFSTPVDSFYTTLSNKYSIPIIRADTSSIFKNEHFADNIHLNENGSKILSLLVASYLKKYSESIINR